MTCLTKIGDTKEQQIITNKNALKIWDEKVKHVNNGWKERVKNTKSLIETPHFFNE